MSHNANRLLLSLLVLLILSGALIFALGQKRAPNLRGGATEVPTLRPLPALASLNQSYNSHTPSIPISGVQTQRDFNRYHDMTVEMISIKPDGFESSKLTRPSGRFLLAINNRSGLKELTFHLIRADGKLMQEARVDSKQPKWRSLVNLPPGMYQLTETTHADWICTIEIMTQR